MFNLLLGVAPWGVAALFAAIFYAPHKSISAAIANPTKRRKTEAQLTQQ